MIDQFYDKGEHNKEVFAYFGRAYYIANVFETGLALSIMQLDFLTETMNRLKRDGRKKFDHTRYEAEFDAYMDRQHTQTLGNLLKRFEKLANIDAPLKQLVSDAKAKRDFIAHHYFRERAEQFCSRRGRDAMIVELDAATSVFEAADAALDAFMEPFRSRLGIRQEVLDAMFARFMKSVASD